ncbi:hypothetical protein AVEN_103957-1 [Araneus ventricosus]|uniref:Endonuclease/exonuclease/phosphatase domain-containing protein n=1 Tax=Araneus ventricosus TaxID=182803 RepID=A0A4Y2MYS5_ARAVE|nr:hypothetical protein AVEN_103957-1 [Araneus ventricosus]
MTIHKSQGATFQEVAIGFKSNLTRPLQYVALSRVTSAKGLYILGEYTKPPPPREDDPIFQEMKRLKANSIIPKFAFLHQHNDPNTLQIMYHNVQSLNAHYEDIAADPCKMNSDILLLAETWTIVKDEFELDSFDHYHLVSDLTKRKPSGVSVYIKKDFKYMVENVEKFPNYDTGIHVMVINFKTKVRIAVLYAKPGSSDDDIFDAIDDSLDVNHIDYKTVLAGDFNININTPKGKEFCDIMENIYYLKLRNNPSDSTTIHQTTIDCIFSTNIVRTCGVYESAFSCHLPLYVQVPWEKMKVRTPIPPEDNDRRLECGPDLLDRTGDIEWEEEDGYPM